jgi:transposase
MSSPDSPTIAIGVGFDTSRYGHHVTFLRDDLQPACPPREFAESRQGYDQLWRQFQQLHERWPTVHFHIRIDAAGQYAANLEAFLRVLPLAKTLTVGEPTRNQNYRKALFPKRKADPVESLCAARFALLEKPSATPPTADAYSQLREIVGRLEGQSRQSTRLTNQLHNLLARVFPELALLVTDLQTRWVLRLLAKHPTPAQLARVSLARLAAIPFLTESKAQTIQAAATTTVASLRGDAAGTLVQHLVRQLRDSLTAEDKLHALMVATYRQLPQPNQLDSIPGIGVATAAVLTAKMVSADRFPSPAHLVSYFGVFPEQDASGIDKNGVAKPGRHTHMSRKGNDLVRKYLWNAAKAAIRCNPAVRPLYRRLRARGTRGDVALGHCMRKLVQLALAIWRTGKPFDPDHYPWTTSTDDANKKTTSHNQGTSPSRSVVIAVSSNVPPADPADKSALYRSLAPAPQTSTGSIDYAALRGQVSMEQVLAHLGCLSQLRGAGAQRRGPCPIHAPKDLRNRSFSVHLDKKVFQCFHPPCAAHGNVLDLWAAVHRLPLYEAARHLCATFHLQTSAAAEQEEEPVSGTRKRNP